MYVYNHYIHETYITSTSEYLVSSVHFQELDFELVWHSCNPNCAFAYKPHSTDIGEIVVEYTCHQTKHEETKSSIQIVAEAPKVRVKLGPNSRFL